MVEVMTRVSLKVGSKSHIPAEIVSFKNIKSKKEHIALIFDQADKTQKSPLVRIHSECLTGDIFHSSRCDCGEQLDEAIDMMAMQGGILVYLRQEGRGIGLYNKIEAYKHQTNGMNTYEANYALGFDDDLREYSEAIDILKALNVSAVNLLTNNPLKAEALNSAKINTNKIIPTLVFEKTDNESYLKAKAKLAEHQIVFN
ncbi:GTP cyclohydrolase [Pseudoalteromonas sp. NBT06-2]|uniref:GTP cyclohydrolase II n=1 Tax=Pseudoalteromonas sp. NBT06-2 TaxID=2025950 RepID=UPI000BA5B431|nr:GTP cyclohydrolase II [Pseudoalteromonas sp. NBT06-2]PAJ74039.1 GTP cyclohydrolase [Pseudoalteromonas sp. NBT06-2]